MTGRNVPRVDQVDFSLTVGTVLPSRVRVTQVPETLIRIHPEWRGHSYFVVRDEIIIVDRGRKVVGSVQVGGSSAQVNRGRNGGGSINLSREEIRELQIVLRDKGFDIGEPDGVMGTRTTKALISFQRQQGFRGTGQIDVETVTALGIKGNFSQQDGNQPSTTGQGNRPDNTGGNSNDGRDRGDGRSNSESRDRSDQPSTNRSDRDRDESQRSGDQDRDGSVTTGQGQGNRDSRSGKDRNDQPSTTGQDRDGNRNRGGRDDSKERGNRPAR